MLNTLDGKLIFMMEIGGNSICFLDLKISVQNNRLETTVYSKPTDGHWYLEASSRHKKSSKNFMIKDVALCLRRICSTMEDIKIKWAEYMVYLVSWEHSWNLSLRKCLLYPDMNQVKKAEKSFENEVTFTSSFNPRGRNVSQIIDRHLHLIRISSFFHNIFPDGSILVANKRCQNWKNLLNRGYPYNIKQDLTDTVPHLYKPCSEKCDSCGNLVASQ